MGVSIGAVTAIPLECPGGPPLAKVRADIFAPSSPYCSADCQYLFTDYAYVTIKVYNNGTNQLVRDMITNHMIYWVVKSPP